MNPQPYYARVFLNVGAQRSASASCVRKLRPVQHLQQPKMLYNRAVDASALASALSGLALGPLRYLPSAGSTNELALRWALEGAPDLALVAAGEQTSGRGRAGRRWYTPAGTALAFSLVLHGGAQSLPHPARLTHLGALAVCEALIEHYRLPAQVKWPNDVLVGGKKVCGVLAEAVWQDQDLLAAVVGIGVNVAAGSIPEGIPLAFPATCLEAETGAPVERPRLLRQILESLLHWRAKLDSPAFLERLEERLALRDQPVRILRPDQPDLHGVIAGLDPGGALRLRLAGGEISTVQFGEVHLRAVDRTPD